MDPIHLRSDELEYELGLRGIFNLANNRARTAALREILIHESLGRSVIPNRSDGLVSSGDEIKNCEAIFRNISEILGSSTLAEAGQKECMSRLIHLKNRLIRIVPADPTQMQLLKDFIEKVNKCTASLEQHLGPASQTASEEQGAHQSPTQLPAVENPFGTNTNICRTPIVVSPVAAPRKSCQRTEINLISIESEIRALSSKNSMRPSTPPIFNSRLPTIQINESIFGNMCLVEQENSERVSIRSNLNPQANSFNPISNGGAAVSAVAQRKSNQAIHSYTYETENRQETHNENLRNPREREINNLWGANNWRANEADFPQPFAVDNQNVRQNNNNHQYNGQAPSQPATRRNNVDFPNPIFNDYSNTRAEFRGQDRSRKTVPVHQWRITFSGDGKGLHLYDFLSQIRLYKESEQVASHELLSSIVHLFSGRARLWYQSVHGYYRSWDELVAAMRKEFLPPGYDFMLLDSISNRAQKPHETASEYIMHMKSLFNCLSVEISEEHMLFIIRKNFLQQYAISIAPMYIANLNHLSDVCRRIDSAYNKNTRIPLPFTEPQNPFNRNFQRPFHGTRELNMVDDEQGFAETENDVELCAIRRQFNNNIKREQPREQPLSRSTGKVKCWNCSGEGHIFPQCTEEKRGKFCYKCGKADVITWHCPNCTGNAERNLESNGVNPNSTTIAPQ